MADTRQEARKRPRPVVSCLRCRDKKLRCDRLSPCTNCAKAAIAGECTYSHSLTASSARKQQRTHSPEYFNVELPLSTTKFNGSVSQTIGMGVVEELQSRVSKLEEQLQRVSRIEEFLALKPPSVQQQSVHPSQHSGGKPSPRSSTLNNSGTPPDFLGTLVVKGSKSRYHGQNDRITLLNQFSEAKEFIDSCVDEPTLRTLAKEVEFLQQKVVHDTNPKKHIPLLQTAASIALKQLRDSLPSRPICDQFVEKYAQGHETTMRILHLPTFRRQYQEFWTSPDLESFNQSAFIPQLTAILGISYALDQGETKIDDPSTEKYLETAALDLVSTWVEALEKKERVEMSTLQTETLLLLARHFRNLSYDKLWRVSGSLVRSAMLMGLHLNPGEFPEISVYQAEMRRRLWMTIVEMDLQASMAAGMQSIVPDIDFTHLIPANINDEDFDESSIQLVPPKPTHEWTNSLAQVTLAMSLQQRLKVTSLVTRTTPEMDLANAVMEGRRLEEFLRHIPGPLTVDYAYQHCPPALLSAVNIDMFMRRPLLCLYRPLLLEDRQDDPSFEEIQRVCLESSLAILKFQDYFDPHLSNLGISNIDAYWNIWQICFKSDALRSALNVCQYIKSSASSPQHGDSPPRSGSRDQMPIEVRSQASDQQFTRSYLTRTVESMLDGLTRRIGESESEIKDNYFLSVILQSVRTRGPTQGKIPLMHEAAKKTLSDCRSTLIQLLEANCRMDTVVPQPPQMPRSTVNLCAPQTQLIHPIPYAYPANQTQTDQWGALLTTEFDHFQFQMFGSGDGNVSLYETWGYGL